MIKKTFLFACLTAVAFTVLASSASAKTRPTPIVQPDPPDNPPDPIQSSR